MQQFFQQLNINTALIVVGGVSLAYTQFKQSADKIAASVVATYKERINQLEEKVNDLIKQDGYKNGLLEEKDKQLKSYESVFQNRNPELEKILTQVTSFMEKLDKRMTESHEELLKQTRIMNETK